MKRYNDLYSKIWDMDNIKLAHKNARKGKTRYGWVQKVDNNPKKYLSQIQDMLKNETYATSPYTIFVKKFHDKERTIYRLPYYPDRIVQHCILQILEPIWNTIFIRNTFSSIKGRGIHDAVKRIQKDIASDDCIYCLKMDISKFYPSINHTILKQIVRKKIKDSKLLRLLDAIIDTAPGVPIGNYLSQFLGNLYLSYFDHWIKEILKSTHYYRYCDDMVLLTSTKECLHRYYKQIDGYLSKNLHLQIKPNYQIFPITNRGVDFLGYVFYKKYTRIRKNIKHRFIVAISKTTKHHKHMGKSAIVGGLMSYFGWFLYANAHNLRLRYFTSDILDILRYNGLTKSMLIRSYR